MRKSATKIGIAILAVVVCITIASLTVHYLSKATLRKTENNLPEAVGPSQAQAKDKQENKSLSDCCCGDADKPRPQASIVCVVNDKATKKVEPDYPQEARTAQISGGVQIQVVVDETGKVIWARAMSGPQLLQKEAMKAACQWQFTPTLLAGTPVKVNGIITFKFVLD